LGIYPANAPPIGFQRCGERLGDFYENGCAAYVADGCQVAVPLLWSAGVDTAPGELFEDDLLHPLA
jgi:hypothetical protein